MSCAARTAGRAKEAEIWCVLSPELVLVEPPLSYVLLNKTNSVIVLIFAVTFALFTSAVKVSLKVTMSAHDAHSSWGYPSIIDFLLLFVCFLPCFSTVLHAVTPLSLIRCVFLFHADTQHTDQNYQLATLSCGDSFGELGLVDNSMRCASCVVASRARVLVVSRYEYRSILQVRR